MKVSKNLQQVESNTVAVWLGKNFEEKCKTLEAPKPNLPEYGWRSVDDRGRFQIMKSNLLYEAMEKWTQESAEKVFKENSPELADLMHWVLPTALETQAAIYWTRPNEESKNNIVRWFAQSSTNNVLMIRKELESICKSYLGNLP